MHKFNVFSAITLDSQIDELLGLFAPDPAFSPSESIEQQIIILTWSIMD